MANEKVALITGAARRVGRTVALRLASAGYDIAFTYFKSLSDAQRLAEEIRQTGRKSVAICANLLEPATAVREIEQQFSKVFSSLDVLVNNASLYEPSSLDQTNLEQMRRFWAIHVESPLMLCQVFGLRLRAARGHVINMVDLLAERPWPKYLAYCSSKAGLWNLTLGLAQELAPEVTVNGIAPGAVQWEDNRPEDDREKYLRRVPLGRVGSPQDVAEAILYLCTTGTYVTGQIIRLDGGRSVT